MCRLSKEGAGAGSWLSYLKRTYSQVHTVRPLLTFLPAQSDSSVIFSPGCMLWPCRQPVNVEAIGAARGEDLILSGVTKTRAHAHTPNRRNVYDTTTPLQVDFHCSQLIPRLLENGVVRRELMQCPLLGGGGHDTKEQENILKSVTRHARHHWGEGKKFRRVHISLFLKFITNM